MHISSPGLFSELFISFDNESLSEDQIVLSLKKNHHQEKYSIFLNHINESRDNLDIP